MRVKVARLPMLFVRIVFYAVPLACGGAFVGSLYYFLGCYYFPEKPGNHATLAAIVFGVVGVFAGAIKWWVDEASTARADEMAPVPPQATRLPGMVEECPQCRRVGRRQPECRKILDARSTQSFDESIVTIAEELHVSVEFQCETCGFQWTKESWVAESVRRFDAQTGAELSASLSGHNSGVSLTS